MSAGSGFDAVRTTRATRGREQGRFSTWAKAGVFPAKQLFHRLGEAGLLSVATRRSEPGSTHLEPSARASPAPAVPLASTATERRAIARDMLRFVVKNRPPRAPGGAAPGAWPSAIPKPPAAPRPPSHRRPHRVVGEPSAAQVREQLILTQRLLQAQQQAVAAQAEAAIAAAREGAEAAAAFGAMAEAEVARLTLRVRELERRSAEATEAAPSPPCPMPRSCRVSLPAASMLATRSVPL